MRRLPALLLCLALFAVSCGDDDSTTDAGGPADESTTTSSTTTSAAPEPTNELDPTTPQGELAAARQRWAEQAPDAYRLTIAEVCFCPETVWVHTVVDGEVTDHQPVSDEAFHDPGPRSMETLFDEIDTILAAEYAVFDALYDPETGAVERYWVDIDEGIADEEHGVEVRSVEAFDPGAPTDEIDAAALTEHHPCGLGFATGNLDQSLGLVISWQGGVDPIEPDLSDGVNFPTDAWSGSVFTGRDLFANWCDDVVEPDEPTPVIDETWTLVAGTLEFTSVPTADPGTGCNGQEATAVLTGAVAGSEAGDQIVLDDIDLHNPAWGCFAG